MRVIPAIDIKGGKVVRLVQGRAASETVYSDSPVDIARRWDSYGVAVLHVVDLDGAFEGRLKNFGIVKEIAGSVKAKVEFGGGLRDAESVKEVLDAGIDKAVIGTKALDDAFLGEACRFYRERIAVAIDAMEGKVYTKGWLAGTATAATDLAKHVAKLGVKTINYTDISRDGTLEGPNIASLKQMLKIKGPDIIASGGISSIDDIKRLKALEPEGLKGIIIGKALYQNAVDLKDAIEICKG